MLLWQELIQDYNELFVRGTKVCQGGYLVCLKHCILLAQPLCGAGEQLRPQKTNLSLSLSSSMIIKTITANHFLNNVMKFLMKDNVAIIDYYLQIFFFILLFPPQNEVN